MDLDDNYDIMDMHLYGYNKTKKWCINTEKVHIECFGIAYNKLTIYERINLALDVLIKNTEGVDIVAFEDFSYGSKESSNSIFQTGEFVGALRKSFYDRGITIDRYSPSSIKNYATGNGNAGKYMMLLAFQQKHPDLFYPEILNDLKLSETPQEDIVDAFWICEILRNKLRLENGLYVPDNEKNKILFPVTKGKHPIIESLRETP